MSCRETPIRRYFVTRRPLVSFPSGGDDENCIADKVGIYKLRDDFGLEMSFQDDKEKLDVEKQVFDEGYELTAVPYGDYSVPSAWSGMYTKLSNLIGF